MTEQSANSRNSDRSSWQSPPQTANDVSIGTTTIRATAKHICPECGERVHSHTEACPACGENLVRTPKPIRCMHCSTRASSELVVCPGCGRELREAPPKVMTLGVPALLALMLVALVASQWDRVSPVAWVRSNLVRGAVLVEDISASIEPEMVIMMTPIAQEDADGSGDNAVAIAPAESIIVSDTQAVAMNSDMSSEGTVAESLVTPLPAESDTQEGNGEEDAPTSVLASAAAEESPIGVGGPRATATQIAEASAAAQDAAPTPELPASDAPLPTATPEPPTPVPPDSASMDNAPASEASVEAPEVQVMAAAADVVEPQNTPTPTWTAVIDNTAADGSDSIITNNAATDNAVTDDTNADSTDVDRRAATPTSEAVVALAVASTPTTQAAGGMGQVSAFTVGETTPVSDNSAAGTLSTVADISATPLPTPTATPTVAMTPLPTPTATPVVYQVRAGDTLVTIASRYDVDVEALMEVNDIGAQDVFSIQPGQMLFIPVELPVEEPIVSTAAVTSSNESAASAAVAVAANTSTVTSAVTSPVTSSVRLEAPVLAVPTDNATIGCETGGKLMWQRVRFVKDSDKYLLHLGFVKGTSSDGPEDVAWVLAQSIPVTQTEWELDRSLCDLAPAQFGHQWRWWVEVVEDVDGRMVPVSPPSVTRGFVWE